MRQTLHAAFRFGASGAGLLLALALALALLPGSLPGTGRLGTMLFPLSTRLLPPPAPTTEIGIVRLPAVPQAAAADQLAAMDALAQALPGMEGVVWWLPNAALREALAWTPEGQRLQAALAGIDAVRERALLQPGSASGSWQAAVLAALGAAPAAAGQEERALPSTAALPLLVAAPAGVEATPLLQAFVRRHAAPTWSAERGLRLADGSYLAGPDGRVYPHGTTPAVPALPLDRLPEAPPAVLIGAAGDPLLDAAAGALADLLQAAYSYTPWWSAALDKLLIALLLAYYLLLLPRLSAGSGFLLTVLVAVGVLALQLGLQLGQRQWLVLAGTYGMLLAGYPLAALNAYAGRDRQRLRRNADTARLALARHQIRQGELDAAREQLLAVTPDPERLELLYELAIAHERRRQYANARDIFAVCAEQDSGYRDVQERLAVLAQVSAPTTLLAARLSTASTLVMPEAVEKPVLGRYQLERELGRGAMGVVYLGVDPKISRSVAIKTLDMALLPRDEVQEFKERFFREAEAAGRLSHPNIVTVYDVGEEGELAFIAMDYASGRPLSEYTDPERLLPVATVYALLAEVAEALDYAHGRGVIHRDIKPANLIYDAEAGTVKITDFGIARVGDTRRTSTGTVLGSPSYMAPEQFAGDEPKGTADLFSLGVTFYQLLTGKLPFTADNVARLAYQISEARHPDIRRLRPELPNSASRIVNKALAKRPGDRYQSGREMAQALRRAAPKLQTG